MTTKSCPATDFFVGSWLVRPSLSRIERDGLDVHLTPRAMSVLVYLGAAKGAVVPRTELLDAVWPRMSVTPDALSQCIAELRRAFADDSRHPAVIETIPRIGLRLLPPVAVLKNVDAPPLARAVLWSLGVALGIAAVAIAAALAFALPRTAPSSVDGSAGRTDEAYELYLTARYFHERADFAKAERYAKQAIDLDPDLALAHAVLAAGLTYRDTPFADPERRARADAASLRAVELDARSAEAHALRAAILWELGDLAGSKRYAERALDLDADDSLAQQVGAWFRMATGDAPAALADMIKARGDEPLSPHAHAMIGQWQYLAGEADAAVASLERALDLAPDHVGGRRVLALAYLAQGLEREAIEQYLRLPIADGLKQLLRERLLPDTFEGTFAIADALSGGYCSGHGLIAAEVFAHYAAAEPMYACLRDAVERSPYPDLTLAFWMKTEPVFAAYRTDERFTEILRSAGLP